MITIVNRNLFGINEDINEKANEKSVSYVVPPGNNLPNPKDMASDGSYRTFLQKPFFDLYGDINEKKSFVGNIRLFPKPTPGHKCPSGKYDSTNIRDNAIGLVAFTYGGIILPVRGNDFCRIMNGAMYSTISKCLYGEDQKTKDQNVLYLALQLNTDAIAEEVRNVRKNGSSEANTYTSPVEVLEHARDLRATDAYKEILAFSTRHLYPNGKTGKRLVQNTVKLRAYIDLETLEISLKLSNVEKVAFDESEFEGRLPSVPTEKVYELHKYEDKRKKREDAPTQDKPFKKQYQDNDRSGYHKDDKYNDNKKKPMSKDTKSGHGNKPIRYNKHGIPIADGPLRFDKE